MKAWAKLTEQGRVGRLRKLAQVALTQYDLEVTKIKLLTVATNTIFRVECADGQKYALRISTPGEHTLQDALCEVKWLGILSAETDLPIPTLIANQVGNPITLCAYPNVPEERRCMLFSWIPGQPIDEVLSPQIYWQLGELMAQMHSFAASYFNQVNAWPNELRPMHWDKLFYYAHEPVVVYDAGYETFFTPARIALIEAVQAVVEPLLQGLYKDNPSQAMIIHGDLHVWNVHVWRNQLFLLDFEDLIWGYPIQDIAITLWYCRDRDNYADLRAAFKSGYSTIRRWPGTDAQIDALGIARTVMFINYAAHALDAPEKYIQQQCEKLPIFLDSQSD